MNSSNKECKHLNVIGYNTKSMDIGLSCKDCNTWLCVHPSEKIKPVFSISIPHKIESWRCDCGLSKTPYPLQKMFEIEYNKGIK